MEKKQKKVSSMLGTLRRKSLFYKTFGMLSLLSVITVILFGIFVDRLVVQAQNDQIDRMNLTQLQRVGDHVDLQLQNMAANAEQTLWSRDFVSQMVNPFQVDADAQFRITNVLEGYVTGNALIQQAFLYLAAAEGVYSSDGTYLDTDEIQGWEVLEQYLTIRQENREAEEESQWCVFEQSGQLFLGVDFCVPNFLGAILIQLDMEQLLSQIQGDSQEETIQVYTPAGQNLFAAGQTWDSGDLPAEGKSQNWYRYTASATGWIYLMPAGAAGLSQNWLSAVGIALPFLAVYALVSQLFSVYITRSVYQPINRLMQITAGQEPQPDPDGKAKNETDYLELAYTDLQGENQQYRQLMESVSRDVAEQLFRNILMRRDITGEQAENTLRGVGMTPFLPGRWLALAGVLVLPEEREPTLVETNLYQRSVLEMLGSQTPQAGQMFSFFVEQGTLAVIGCFPQEVSVLRIKQWAQELIREIERQTENLPFSLFFGKGKVYNDLLSLADSYQEADAEARYRRYMAETPADGQSQEFGPRYYRERGRQVAEMAEKGDAGEAEQTARRLVREIEEGETPEVCQSYYELILEAMLEKLTECHVLEDADKEAAFSRSPEELRGQKGIPEMRRFMDNFYQEAVREIQSAGKKNRYRYVKAAKQYIASHYTDGNLSLNEVSDAIGISAPYLSGIFAESVKGGFSSWLNAFRVEQAKKFLQETQESAADIGYKCGFNSAQSFNRVFKKHTGFTPGQYRRQHKEEGKNEETLD